MDKRLWLVAVFLVLFLVSSVNAFSGSGAGTSGDPYQITSYSQLDEIRNEMAYYKLMNNIDCAGNTWTPIYGISGATFHLDGQGYTVSNFHVHGNYANGAGRGAGFIGYSNDISSFKGASIFYNIVFKNADIINTNADVSAYAGVLGGLISKSGAAYAGYTADRVFIYDSSVKCSSNSCYVGAVVARASMHLGVRDVGVYNTTLTMVGETSDNIGSIAGRFWNDASQTVIENSYSNLSAVSMVGYTTGSLVATSAYWDSSFGSAGYLGTSTSTANMKTQGTYTDWDFSNVWKMSSGSGHFQGYPILKVMTDYADASAPVASFTKDKTGGTSPLTVTFTDTSTNTPTSWLWVFGDGDSTNSTVQNPIHTFTGAGTYNVNLTATNSAGSNTTATQAIVVGIPPVASFTPASYSGAQPMTVNFVDTSTNSPTSWFWVFGDGNTSTLQNPSNDYYGETTYYANLTATNTYGSNTSSLHAMTTGDDPTASFTKDKTSGADPLTVTFDGTYTGTAPLTYLWVFGDGDSTNSTVADPIHTFTGVGVYNVNVTVSNVFGIYTTATQSITVGDAPISAFTKDKSSGAPPLTVLFYDASTGGTPDTWLYVSSDGWTANTANAGHAFAFGVWTVNLTVANAYGSSTSATQTIDVGNAANASFIMDYQYRTIGQAVQFNDTTLNSPTAWLYVCSDGQTSILQNASFSFPTAGTKACNLTATNTYGASTSPLEYVYVGYAPVTNWNWVPAPPQFVGTTVEFTDYNAGYPPYTYGWNVKAPNGTYYYNLSTTNPGYVTFDAVGTWSVSSRVTNNYGSNVPAWYNYQINTPVVANFTASPLSGYDYLAVQFTDTSTGSPTAWNWTFTNTIGTTFYNTTQNPLRYFNHGGGIPPAWDVTLTVSKAGVPDNTTFKHEYLTVYPLAPNFTVSNVTPVEEQTITFTDTSLGNPTDWNWSFGDGQYSSLQNPTHAYSGYSITYFKLFNVSLTIGNGSAIRMTLPRTNYINVSQTKPTALAYVPNVTSGTGYLPPDLVVEFGGYYNPGYPDSVDWYFDGTHSTSWNPVATFDYHVQDPAIPVHVNYSYVNEMGRSNWYNSTYTFLGRVPKATVPIQFAPLSGTTIPPAHVHMQTLGYAAYDNGTWYGVPTSWYWTFGDGATDTTTTSLTNHTYAAGGTYPVTVRPSNVWGNGATETTNYTVLTLAPFGAPLKWVNNAGSTITTARKGDSLTFVFDTNVTGIGGLYNYDRFYINVFRMDMTGAWVEALLKDSMGNEITQYYVQEYGIETMFSSDIHNWMPTGKRWNGYVTFTAADGNATYRGQVTAVNVTNSITYPSSVLSTDISVTDNPLLMSNVGQAANDTGGFALKLIIGVIIVLGLMAIPFLITREFNTYIEVFMIVLGLGLNYYLGLIDLWIIAGLGILAAVIVFFMSTGGRGGGDSTEGGGGDVG